MTEFIYCKVNETKIFIFKFPKIIRKILIFKNLFGDGKNSMGVDL